MLFLLLCRSFGNIVCFFSFARKFCNQYGKKIYGYCNKSRNRSAKTASKRVGRKTTEAAWHSIENKITDKITSVGKT